MWRRFGSGLLALCLGAVGLIAAPAAGAGAGTQSRLTIPLGMIIPIDTPHITWEQNKIALEASVKAYNKRNKDVQFTLTVCDGKNDPNAEADCAREMVAKGVVATVGDTATINPTGVNQILAAANIPRIGLTMTGLSEFSSPVSFPLGSGPILAAVGAAQAFADRGVKKVSVVRTDQAAGAVLVDALLRAPYRKAGVEIVNDVPVPVGTTDYSSHVAAAQTNGAEGVMVVMPQTQSLPFAKAATELGMKLPMSLALFGSSLQDILDSGYKDWVLVDSFPPPEEVNGKPKRFPNLKQFLADMKAAKNKTLAPSKLSGSMVSHWLALHVITEVTKGMTTVDGPSLKAALDAAQNIDMLGIIPPWTPSKQGPGMFTRASNTNLGRIDFDGKHLVATPKNPVDFATYFG